MDTGREIFGRLEIAGFERLNERRGVRGLVQSGAFSIDRVVSISLPPFLPPAQRKRFVGESFEVDRRSVRDFRYSEQGNCEAERPAREHVGVSVHA